MAWVAVGGAVAGAAVTGMMNKGGGSGGGTTTQTKDPWSAAVPWLQNNLQTGQNLQSYYQQNPFNALQQGAYSNLLGNNDYINQMVPSMLGQFSQSQGFDRNNPRARPMAIQFPQMQARAPMLGLLNAAPGGGVNPSAGGNMNVTQNPYANGLLPSVPAAAAPAGPVAAPGSLWDLGSGTKYATFDPSSGGGG